MQATEQVEKYHPLSHEVWSGRRVSNPRPSAWQADTLPLSYTRIFAMRGEIDVVCWSRHRGAANERIGGPYRDRTDDLLNANQALSQLS